MEHPPQANSPCWSWCLPSLVLSQAQLRRSPRLQAREMEWTTPAELMAYTKAASRLPAIPNTIEISRRFLLRNLAKSKLTFHEGFPKDGGIPIDGGTIPSVLTELILAFLDSGSCTFANLDHVIRMLLAKPSLFAFHAGDVVAIHSRISCCAQLKFAQEPCCFQKNIIYYWKQKGFFLFVMVHG